jgi:hypothetical protein
MAPVMLFPSTTSYLDVAAVSTAASAWETQASGRHCRFGAKSAPRHRDFAPEKVEVF